MDTAHGSSLSALSGLPPQEKRLVWLAFAWIFVTIAAYSIIGSVRAGMLLFRFGEAALPWAFMASAVSTGAAVWAYNSLAGRLSRRALVRATLAALAVTLAAWAALVAVKPAAGWAAFIFSLWSDVFGIMSVTLFWSYADDLFTTGEAKKVYGLVASAGPLGSILGSLLTTLGAVRLGLSPLLWIACALFSVTLLTHAAMEGVTRAPDAERAAAREPSASAAPTAGVLRTIARSPFLLALAAVVFLERLVPDFSDYLFGAALHAHFHGAQAIARFQGLYSLVEGGASLLASVLLTRWVLERLGLGAALTTAPLANLVGLLVFPFSPTLGWTAGYNAAEGLLRYTWFKSAKEASYTAESRDVVYRVKAFIEMFVYRFARGVAGFLLLLLTGGALLHHGARAVALAGVPLALAWVYAARRMGQEAKAA
jgi:AAA family ATP:ADP antiporter